MKTKWFVLFSALVIASLFLSACGGAGSGGNMKTEIGEGEGEVVDPAGQAAPRSNRRQAPWRQRQIIASPNKIT